MLDFSTVHGRSGILAYLSGKPAEERRKLARIKPSGDTDVFPAPAGAITPSFSPDGKRVAFSAEGNIMIGDLERGANMALTRNGLMNNSPIWTPDGKHIVFDQDAGDESVIWWVRADGSQSRGGCSLRWKWIASALHLRRWPPTCLFKTESSEWMGHLDHAPDFRSGGFRQS